MAPPLVLRLAIGSHLRQRVVGSIGATAGQRLDVINDVAFSGHSGNIGIAWHHDRRIKPLRHLDQVAHHQFKYATCSVHSGSKKCC